MLNLNELISEYNEYVKNVKDANHNAVDFETWLSDGIDNTINLNAMKNSAELLSVLKQTFEALAEGDYNEMHVEQIVNVLEKSAR